MKRKKGYVEKLIEQGEGLHLDFKFEVSDAAKIARSLSAFANTDGGTLLIGVKDNGKIKGIRSEEEYYMIENAAQRYCRPQVVFSSKEWNVEGEKILEITIPKSKTLPHKAPDKNGKYKAFVRIADENILACSVQMKVWKKQNSDTVINFKNSDTEKRLLNILQSNKNSTIPYLLQQLKIPKYRIENLLSDFILLELVKMEYSASGCFFNVNDIPAL